MLPINFTATHIKNVEISKLKNGKYSPCSVSLVEMDPADRRDINSMRKISENWEYSLTDFVVDDMEHAKDDSELREKMSVYALTTQKSNYKKIKPDRVLGVIEIEKDYNDGNKINILQTHPDYVSKLRVSNPQYKHIGQELVKYSQDKYDSKPLYVHPVRYAIDFYKKLGFSNVPGRELNNLYWYIPKNAKKEIYA